MDVFDSTGVYLGPVSVGLRLPSATLLGWGPDGLTVVIEDAEGRPTVVRFRVEKR